MNEPWTLAIGLVFTTGVVGLLRVWAGPTPFDRMLAAQLLGTSLVATLVLAADSAHTNRPRGADPLNIRDRLDWLEPTLTFHPEQLRDEVTRVACAHHPAWQDWDVQIGGDGAAPFVNREVDPAVEAASFSLDVASQGRAITLSAKRPVTADDRWLYLNACQVERTDPAGKFEIRIAGETLARAQ